MKIKCWECSAACSSEFEPVGLPFILRATVMCPECLEAADEGAGQPSRQRAAEIPALADSEDVFPGSPPADVGNGLRRDIESRREDPL